MNCHEVLKLQRWKSLDLGRSAGICSLLFFLAVPWVSHAEEVDKTLVPPEKVSDIGPGDREIFSDVKDFGRVKFIDKRFARKVNAGDIHEYHIDVRKIQFLDEKREIAKEIKLEGFDWPVISNDKKLIGIQKLSYPYQKLIIYGGGGNKISEHPAILPLSAIIIANDGSFAALGADNSPDIPPLENKLVFYDSKGLPLKTYTYENSGNLYGRYLFGDDNFILLIHLIKEGIFKLAFFKKTGEELWTRDFDFPAGTMFRGQDLLTVDEPGKTFQVKLFYSKDNQEKTWLFTPSGEISK